MCEFSGYAAFSKATNGHTDTKHKMRKRTQLMSLLKIADESTVPSLAKIEFGIKLCLLCYLKAMYAENSHITFLSSRYLKSFISNLLLVLI